MSLSSSRTASSISWNLVESLLSPSDVFSFSAHCCNTRTARQKSSTVRSCECHEDGAVFELIGIFVRSELTAPTIFFPCYISLNNKGNTSCSKVALTAKIFVNKDRSPVLSDDNELIKSRAYTRRNSLLKLGSSAALIAPFCLT